jgi:hypothetical protein
MSDDIPEIELCLKSYPPTEESIEKWRQEISHPMFLSYHHVNTVEELLAKQDNMLFRPEEQLAKIRNGNYTPPPSGKELLFMIAPIIYNDPYA